MDLLNQFKSFLLSQKYQPSKVTVKNYLSDINHFLRFFEIEYQKPFSPSDINFNVIRNYKDKSLNSLSQTSVDRHISSLRKLCSFLKLDGQISSNPFEIESLRSKTEADPWHLREFKDYLYVFNASHLTIKNYIIDIRQFLTWIEQVAQPDVALATNQVDALSKISRELVEEYKQRLISQGEFSPASINRKLSSLRKYLQWMEDEGLIKNNAQVANVKIAKPTAIEQPQPQIQATEKKEFRYSPFPPFRLFQKLGVGFIFLLDKSVINSTANFVSKLDYLFWKIKGKPIFKAKPIASISKVLPNHNLLRISNIKKEFYAPLEISTKSFPLYKRAFFVARYYRPKWYKTYHSYPIVHYFHFAVLIIFMAGIGFGFYNTFIQSGRQAPTLAAGTTPTAPPRFLAFQGRLTDSSDNPIVAPTYLRFTLYDAQYPASAASDLLWQEEDLVSPDQDGIFNVSLGNTANVCANPLTPATAQCQMSQALFASNSALFLGITVANTPELTPRQQVATVAFASNAETLQGMAPITQTGVGAKNVVLALDSNGNLTIGSALITASPVFQAANGSLTLTGQPLIMTTNTGSNSNVYISADGWGKIALNKPLTSGSQSNNISTAIGSVEVDSLFSVLATSSGQSAVTINQTGGGPLISASSSGNARFTVDNSGNITVAGTTGFGTKTYTWPSTALYAGYVLSTTDTNGTLGWVAQTASSGFNFWQELTGALSPIHIGDDLLLGSSSTSSAAFAFTGLMGTTTQASFSGQFVLMPNKGYGGSASISGQLILGALGGNPTIQTTNNQLLTIGGNSTGRISLSPLNGAAVAVGGTGGLILAGYTGSGSGCTLKTDANGNVQCQTDLNSGSYNFWQELIGALSPIQAGDDLLIGGTTTASAKFAFINVGSGSPTASISGNLSLVVPTTKTAPANTFNILSGGSLNFQTSVGGDSGLVSALYIANNGNIGIGNSNPQAKLDIGGASSTIANTSGNITITPTGNLVLTSTAGSGVLIGSSANVIAPLSISGGIGNNAALIVNQLNSGDLFTASASGVTKFTITNGGGISLGGSVSDTSHCIIGGTPAAWGTCGSYNFWQELIGALSPIQSGDDLLLGNKATGSAAFAFTGLMNNTASGNHQTQASFSGQLIVMPNNGYGGNVGIGITTPAYPLDVINTTNPQLRLGYSTSLYATIGADNNGNLNLVTPNNANAGIDIVAGINANNGTNEAITLKSNQTLGSNDELVGVLNNSNQLFTILGSGNTGINTVSPLSTLDVRANTLNAAAASFSANMNFASLIANNNGTGDIFTASSSGWTRFAINRFGAIGLTGTAGSPIYGSVGNCLLSGGSGAASSWGACSTGNYNFWQELIGALSPLRSGDDFLLGGSSTASADFAFTGMMGTNTQASFSGQFVLMPNKGYGGSASISGQLIVGALGGNPTIQTTNNQLLTIGGNTTGTIAISPLNGGAGSNLNLNAATTTLSGSEQINGTTLTINNASAAITTGTGQTLGINPNGSGALNLGTTSTGNVTIGDNNTTEAVSLVSGSGGVNLNTTTNQPTSINTGTSTGTVSIGNSASTLTVLGTVNINTTGTVGTSIGNSTGTLSLKGTNITTAQVAYGSSNTLSFTSGGSSGNCLLYGASNPSWGSCASGNYNFWQELIGALSPIQTGDDLLIGGSATSSADFAFTGLSTPLHQTQASFSGQFVVAPNVGYGGSASVAGTLTVGSWGLPAVIQTTNNQLLTIGGNTTGTIAISPLNGGAGSNLNLNAATTTLSGSEQINGTTLTINNASAAITTGTGQTLGINPNGSGALNLGTTSTGNVTIGDNNTTEAVSLVSGSGGVNLNTTTNQPTSINTGTSTGTVSIGNSASTLTVLGTVNINTTGTVGTSIGNSTGTLSLKGTNITTAQVAYGSSNTLSFTSGGSSGNCLLYGASNPSWGACTGADLYWQELIGAISPLRSGDDFLLGGSSTASADFAFTGMMGTNTQASFSGQFVLMPNKGYGGSASISGQLIVGALGGNPTIQTTNNQLLTIGGNTTGTIAISPLNGGAGSNLNLNAATTTLSGSEQINGTTLTINNASAAITTGTGQTLGINPNGSGALNLGTTSTGNVTIGDNNTTEAVSLVSGSGGVNLNTTTNQPTSINTGTSTGTVSIGNSASTLTVLGTVNINTTGTVGTSIGNSTGTLSLKGTNITTAQVAYGSSNTLSFTSGGSSGNCLLYGASNPSWGACTGADLYWQELIGAISPLRSGDDFLLGGSSTASADFAFTGNDGN